MIDEKHNLNFTDGLKYCRIGKHYSNKTEIDYEPRVIRQVVNTVVWYKQTICLVINLVIEFLTQAIQSDITKY